MIEDMLVEVADHFCNIEVLVSPESTGGRLYGIRLRPYGRGAQKDVMVLASGATFEAALTASVEKARAGRFEALDYAKRPWGVGAQHTGWGPKERPQFDR